MKKIAKMKSVMLFALFSLFVLSCEKNSEIDKEPETSKSIVETAQETDILSSLVAALAKADETEGTNLIGTLSGEGPFTVFAPTNDAFTSLLANLEGYDSLEDFDTPEKRDLLATILTYHVVAAVAAKSTDLSDGQTIATVQGEEITIILDGGVFVQDATEENSEVISADIETSNGIVHVIDKVLVPQAVLNALEAQSNLENIVETAIATDDLSLLVSSLQQAEAGLVDILSGVGPFTVFAPTNEAFANLLAALGDDYNSLADFDTEDEKALLVKILNYHVVNGTAAFSGDLWNGQEIATAQGENVTLHIDGGVFIEDASEDKAKVVISDVEASNGVVHIIDKVLLPQEVLDILSPALPNIVGLAQSVDDLSILVEALIKADASLVDILSSDGPFTVFAPTNDAFEGLLDLLGDHYNSLADFDTQEEKDLLVKILTYHVVSGTKAFSNDLSDHQMIKTVQEEEVAIRINGHGEIHIDDATDTNASVVAADIEASNGVVHLIDKVLLPQEVLDALRPNIVGLAQSVDDLSLLVEALIQADAGLVEVLSGDGPFTVFAPTNHAFEGMLNLLGNEYHSLADFDTHDEKVLLAKILTYHVIAGVTVASGDLKNHQVIGTVQGESITTVVGSRIKIIDKTHDKAKVIGADNVASNGIVHLIDKVLLPQEVLDALGH